MTRNITFFTGTRADWGLLSPLARALGEAGCRVDVVAGTAHLDARRGLTLEAVRADGFEPLEGGPAPEGDTPVDVARAMAGALTAAAVRLNELRPDMAVILGDRYEALAAAEACLLARVPLTHIAGGETTLGAIDDAMRHAITHMAALHLTQTEEYRQRVVALGADPARALNVGSLGVANITALEPVADAELDAFLDGLSIDRRTAIVTYHPATLDPGDPAERTRAFTRALDATAAALPGFKAVVTAANNDAGGDAVLAELRRWVEADPATRRFTPSMGHRRYLSALRRAGVVAGNSSSGIIEAPSMGLPTVDVGCRQQGRTAAPSVIHCADDTASVSDALLRAFSPEARALAERRVNPYYQPDTISRSVEAIIHHSGPRG